MTYNMHDISFHENPLISSKAINWGGDKYGRNVASERLRLKTNVCISQNMEHSKVNKYDF
jgi:hypothetical protein